MEIPANQFDSIYFTVTYDALTISNITAQPFMKVVSVSYITAKSLMRVVSVSGITVQKRAMNFALIALQKETFYFPFIEIFYSSIKKIKTRLNQVPDL